MDALWFRRAARAAYVLRVAVSLVVGSVFAGDVASAASPVTLPGSLVGSVRDSSGLPQIGAVVHLLSRQEKLLQKTITNVNGEFGFDSLLPDFYSVRVQMTSFMPALKRNISVQPGMRSVLAINVATLLSSIELVYSSPTPGLMSDNWRHVLRSTMTTRPILRAIPGIDQASSQESSSSGPFSDTRGILRVAAGETSSGLAGQADFGTSFALATSLFGRNQLQVSGNIGYGEASDLTSASFRTTFSRTDSLGPEVKLTMQQVGMPLRTGGVLGGNSPALRTMTITALEHVEIGDGLEVDYGASLHSVTFMDRLNYLSPFARVSYSVGKGDFAVAFSSGAPPVDLLAVRDASGANDLQNDLATLSVMPRISLRNGGANVQRTTNLELSYNYDFGSTELTFGAYREAVSNGALALQAPTGFYMGDLLPDLSSSSSFFNIGHYKRYGYSIAVTQDLNEDFQATLAAGRASVLTAGGRELDTASPDELRGLIRQSPRIWVRGKLAGRIPVSHTRFVTSYEWRDQNTLTPGHVYLTQSIHPETGLNLRFHQPLPFGGVLPGGRIEATADLRNLLAQGYLPITLADGRCLVLAQSPRSVRGGLSFIF